jgi:coenzyme PQQ biosynthesis protein PqqD
MTALLEQRVRLSEVARLRFDPQTNTNVLLSPERGLRLNASASAVIERCTGQLTVREIVHELFDAVSMQSGPLTLSIEQMTSEVIELIENLRLRRLLTVVQNT